MVTKKRKDNILFIDGMKELEEDQKRELDERLLRVRDHIVEKYETEHEDDDYYHNKLISTVNEPETMKDIPMEADIIIKKEVKKSKKKKRLALMIKKKFQRKKRSKRRKKRKTIRRIVLTNLNQRT